MSAWKGLRTPEKPRGAAVTLVRSTDPVESQEAAEKIALHVGRDQKTILECFNAIGPATFWEAAVEAVANEGVNGAHFHARAESLRRRGSDLRAKGLIEQTGTKGGRATFTITPKGLKALRVAS